MARASRGESATDIARGIAAETGVVGRVGGGVGGRVVKMLGLSGKGVERATRVAEEVRKLSQSQGGQGQGGGGENVGAVGEGRI